MQTFLLELSTYLGGIAAIVFLWDRFIAVRMDHFRERARLTSLVWSCAIGGLLGGMTWFAFGLIGWFGLSATLLGIAGLTSLDLPYIRAIRLHLLMVVWTGAIWGSFVFLAAYILIAVFGMGGYQNGVFHQPFMRSYSGLGIALLGGGIMPLVLVRNWRRSQRRA
jgi:hypothetical protein